MHRVARRHVGRNLLLLVLAPLPLSGPQVNSGDILLLPPRCWIRDARCEITRHGSPGPGIKERHIIQRAGDLTIPLLPAPREQSTQYGPYERLPAWAMRFDDQNRVCTCNIRTRIARARVGPIENGRDGSTISKYIQRVIVQVQKVVGIASGSMERRRECGFDSTRPLNPAGLGLRQQSRGADLMQTSLHAPKSQTKRPHTPGSALDCVG